MTTSDPEIQPTPRRESAPAGDSTVVFRRLLVPLDGSHLAEAVLPVATRLVESCGATIVLLHLLEKGAPRTVHGDRHLTNKEEAERYLGDLSQRLATAPHPVEWHTHEVPVGDVAAGIAAHTGEHRIDAVILSTHGHGGIGRALWGSIAQQTLQRSLVPVLLTRANAEAASAAFAPRTIMVPLDATAASEAALPPAISLARCLGSQLRLVMVVATIDTVSGEKLPTATLLPVTTRALLDLEEKQATEHLTRLAETIRATGVPTVAEVRRGDAVAQLATDAGEHADGLVVVATHGRAGLQAIWSPSVAARLLTRTRAPILLVPIVE